MANQSAFAAITDSTWTTLTQLLRQSVIHCGRGCSSHDRVLLEQQSDDLVQDFLLRKLRRPAWVAFIQRCARAITRRHLPLRLRTDFRAFVFRRLKQIHKANTFSRPWDFSRDWVLGIAARTSLQATEQMMTAELWIRYSRMFA